MEESGTIPCTSLSAGFMELQRSVALKQHSYRPMPLLPRIVLASTSPRRQALLRQMGADFIVVPPRAEEDSIPGEPPAELVRRLSLDKARSVPSQPGAGVILGSDTVVVLDGRILGKPTDPDDARHMLRSLSGRAHVVFTGYALIDTASGQTEVGHVETTVTFRELGVDEIDHYVDSGSPMDKAGAYGIQDDFGAVFIERIDGDYYTVVGLPLCHVYQALRRFAQEHA